MAANQTIRVEQKSNFSAERTIDMEDRGRSNADHICQWERFPLAMFFAAADVARALRDGANVDDVLALARVAYNTEFNEDSVRTIAGALLEKSGGDQGALNVLPWDWKYNEPMARHESYTGLEFLAANYVANHSFVASEHRDDCVCEARTKYAPFLEDSGIMRLARNLASEWRASAP